MTNTQFTISISIAAVAALGGWWVIGRDARQRRKNGAGVVARLQLRHVEIQGDLELHVGRMLFLNHKSAVVAMVVKDAFSTVVREASEGHLPFEAAQARLDEVARVGILKKMEEDYRRALAHGREQTNPPTVGRNGTLPQSAKFHLECMPAYERLKFMESLIQQPIGEPR
jgi:hypothetical protein